MPAPSSTLAAFSLAGRTAIVTGAAGLLGRQHCRALADAGALVVATDLDAGALERTVAELSFDAPAGAGKVVPVAADITSAASLKVLRDETLRLGDRVDVLVNNAAANDRFQDHGEERGDASDAAAPTRFENYPVEAFRRAMEVNVTGMFLSCQVLGAEMARRSGGSIINVASTYGLVGPDQRIYKRPDGSQGFWKSPSYPASKGAVLAFTRFLATTWADRNVRVNSLSPGGVAQDGQEPYFVEHYALRTPLGRMAKSDELRGAVLFLASDASTYVTGSNVVVDGGWTAW
ncbi:MAG TPA: SDR family oxidoreductase [Polyangia bacterium]|nr:SDR family oxidoreductase [Polyangia bacterium]